LRGRKALWGFVFIVAACVVVVILLDFVFYIQRPKEEKWKLVASFGMVRIVYVDPRYIDDESLIKAILDKLVYEDRAVCILFFDHLEKAPLSFPMTDEQMWFWKARYLYNPYSGYEKFHRIKLTDLFASPPEMDFIEVDIRPPKFVKRGLPKGGRLHEEEDL